jgi:hypothetical protein
MMSVIVHIESMLQFFYVFFSHNPKKVLEFLTFAKIIMPICMASYMMVGYGHAHHVF